MASTRRKTTKAGRDFYEIRVNLGRDQPQLSRRWYVPDGWSKRTIDRELVKVAAEFERQCRAGEVLTKAQEREIKAHRAREEAKKPTLRKYVETVFMPAKNVTISENTRKSFQSRFDTRIFPALGSYKLCEITPAQLNAFLLSLQADGLSIGTVTAYCTLLKLLFKEALLSDVIVKNPMDKVKRPRPRKEELQNTEVESYTAKELSYILECADREPLKWRTMLHLLSDTGIRIGECVGLQWSDFDFKAKSVTIQRTAGYSKEQGFFTSPPKNGKTRTLDVSSGVLDLLRLLQNDQASKAISKYVFTQEGQPSPMYPGSPANYMIRFGKRYGVKDLHPHKLRHSFASIAITNGADIASVSEKLGHSNKAMTLKMYTHADQESIKRAGEIFREAIKKA